MDNKTIHNCGLSFLHKRIQMAMVVEALAIAEAGLVMSQEVDQIVRASFGFRQSA